MFLKRTVFAIISLLTLSIVASADPGLPDTVSVADVQANAGDHFSVPIFLTNDEALSGGTLGFTWGDPDLFLDSVSYLGGVLESKPAGQRPITILNDIQQVLTGFFTIFDPAVPAGSGLWATLWFTADGGAPDKVIPIDSIKVEPSGEFVLIAQNGNEAVSPQYVAGSVTLGSPSSNTAPALDSIVNQFVMEGASLNVPVNAIDAESVPTLSAMGTPTFGGFVDAGDGTGSFSFNPGFDDSGAYPISVIASDGELSDTTSFMLTVGNTNRAPQWAAVAPQVVPEGLHLGFAVSATDMDGDDLALSMLSGPINSGFTDNGGGAGMVTFDPDFTQAGAHTVSLEATDGDLTDTLIIDITVLDVNRDPAIYPITDTTIDIGQALAIAVSATDPDADSLVLTVDGIPAANASFTDNGDGTGSFAFTPDGSQGGMTFNMVANATDGEATASDSFAVTVNPAQNTDTAWVDVDTLYFAAQVGGDNPDNQCPGVWSSNAPAPYAITDIQGSPAFTVTTNTTGSTNESLCIGVNTAELPAGAYYNTVSIEVDSVVNNPISFVMCLTMTDAPVPDSAFVSSDTLFFTALEGSGMTDSQCVTISSTNAPAAFTLAGVSGSPMVFTSPVNDAGTTDGAMCVVASPGDLAPGTHYNTVTVNVDGVDNSPVSFVTCLTVEAAPEPQTLAISDTLFVYDAVYGVSSMIQDTVYISNSGGGESFGWTVMKTLFSYTDTLGAVTTDTAGIAMPGMLVGPLAGTTPGSVVFTQSNDSLMPGQYACMYSVMADSGVLSSPQMFSIQVTVAMPEVDSGLTVLFDLKPGSCVNPINNNHHGNANKAVVPAAIIGSQDFDISDIDVSTIMLEGISPVRWSIEDVTEPFDPGDSCGCVETEPDGIDDLTLKFYRSDLLAAAGDLEEGRNPLTITGKLNDGTEFSAVDCFETRPKNKDGRGVDVNPVSQSLGEPDDFTLVGNYPNPFNPATKIVVGVPTASHVTVVIYNLIGQRIETLHSGQLDSGYHTFEWDATDQASGMYFYSMKTGAYSESRKMLLLK